MVKRFVLVLFTLLFAICCKAQNKGFAVVELFTSEGCSSCPKGDAVVARLRDDYKGSVYVLGFHVDYWNRLGWQDVYSSKEYSKRQGEYASALKLPSVYTPQAIVNGKHELVGSERGELYSLVADALKKTPVSGISLSVKHADGNKILVSYAVTNSEKAALNIALVQSNATTEVKKGENAGKKLPHINIVRAFKTITLNKDRGETMIELPAALSYNNCTLIAFTQKSNMEITAATEAVIN